MTWLQLGIALYLSAGALVVALTWYAVSLPGHLIVLLIWPLILWKVLNGGDDR